MIPCFIWSAIMLWYCNMISGFLSSFLISLSNLALLGISLVSKGGCPSFHGSRVE